VQKKMKKRKRKDPDFEIPDLDFKSPRDPAEFDLKENSMFIKEEPDNPDLRIGLGELLRAAHFKKHGTMVVSEAFYDCNNDMLDPKTGKGNLSAAYTWGTQAIEVEVDQETGEVKIVDFVSANDVGRVINKQTLMGQFYGASAMGFGYALSEECKTEQGRSMNPNYLDYKIFTAPDMDFPIHVELIETNDKEGPFGAKGVGEPGLVPTAPAIANAVYDAIGVRIKSLPITPEKVLAALKEKKKQ
jgi:CO/xanthine dehydrogenase Mo-binding subunit